ncbi:hypothetical protein FBY35_3495 [Streptomyces sp. SLBN-118]|uniref:hypothetical protein n=1 Tax=Streptomyces sp. SLBN-118 TaxID=2768454 RepID=UPI00114EBA7C|nr:hypothetical protein [Streptomyces sp. SLBN-118]TQK53027.1 hypothetical protein FBY35_3495 [Streptomyces sp. SLBN-118]
MNANRLRPVVLALAAVTLTAVLTGCKEDGSDAGAATPSAGAKATPSPSTTAHKPDPKPSVGATAPSSPGAGVGGTPAGKPGAKHKGSPATKAPAAGCASKPPSPDHVDPDEFAVYRVEELDGSTGKVNLVVEHGAWGCPGKDTDGAPFVVTGEHSRWALDQAAYVTATNPITDSSENKRIGVQELIDWINAHPDSGLVFRYETGKDGAIHRLEQVFTP